MLLRLTLLEFRFVKSSALRAFIVGFLTLSSSSKGRSFSKDGQTSGSARGDVQDETPCGNSSRKSRHFGRLDVQATGSRTPQRDHDGTSVYSLKNCGNPVYCSNVASDYPRQMQILSSLTCPIGAILMQLCYQPTQSVLLQ